MGGKTTSPLSRKEQVAFLTARGFEPVRNTGGHEVWENPAYKKLAEKLGLEVPANLLSARNVAAASTIVLPYETSFGTWHRISKVAEWCHEQVQKAGSEVSAQFENSVAGEKKKAPCWEPGQYPRGGKHPSFKKK